MTAASPSVLGGVVIRWMPTGGQTGEVPVKLPTKPTPTHPRMAATAYVPSYLRMGRGGTYSLVSTWTCDTSTWRVVMSALVSTGMPVYTAYFLPASADG